MAGPSSPDAGPDFAPPSLPPGWIAQWDGKSRKYYFVQISTGESTWEVPTQAAPQVPTPGATPAQEANPFRMPENESSRGYGQEGGEGERGLGTDMLRMAMGGKQSQSQGGLVGSLAQSFLGGSSNSGSHQQQSSSSSSGLGGLAQSFLGGSSSNSHSGSSGAGHNSTQGQSSSSSGGLMGQIGGFLGGHGKQSGQNYGYSSNGNTGTYTGTAPAASYQAHTGQSFKPQGGSYEPHGSGNQQPGGQYGNQQPGSQFGTQHSGSQYGNQQSGSQYGSQQSTPGAGQYGGQQHPPPGQFGGTDPSHSSSQPQGGYGQHQGSFGQQSNNYGAQGTSGGYGSNDHHGHPPPGSFNQGPPGDMVHLRAVHLVAMVHHLGVLLEGMAHHQVDHLGEQEATSHIPATSSKVVTTHNLSKATVSKMVAIQDKATTTIRTLVGIGDQAGDRHILLPRYSAMM
ncbi:hypothetical protein AMS68_007686 [Peltaster fructicola]|uniref:WW domain-containing protein n=1 Tax=Peltaster fructicola TaxID=286661 RepID=A0A6H0Y5Q9_9PEZI|nr:hypothetical protein AMS68_007686 [Peltaster fructicola]